MFLQKANQSNHRADRCAHATRLIWAGLTLLFICLLICVLITPDPASALDIQLTDIGSTPMTAAQMTAFEQAAQLWENKYSDPITVNINIAWDAPENFSHSDIIASTSSARTTVNWTTMRTAMDTDASGTSGNILHSESVCQENL